MNDTSYNPSTRNPIYVTCAYDDNIKIKRICERNRTITDFTKTNSHCIMNEAKSIRREL